MPIPLILLIGGGLALGAGALVLADDDQGVIWPAAGMPAFQSVQAGAGGIVGEAVSTTAEEEKKTGPLPGGALDAWASSGFGPQNDIHKNQSWLRYATYSKRWHKVLKRINFKSDPPGAIRVKGKSKRQNLIWMMQAPEPWYPDNGPRPWRRAEVDALKQWLSPSADWDTFKGIFSDSVENIPEVLEGAGIVSAAAGSGGVTASKETAEQVKKVANALKKALEPYGNVGRSIKKRRAAAAAVLGVLIQQYERRLMHHNPWATRDGELQIGKHYMANPQTYEDLEHGLGESRPLLWNP